MGASRTRLAVCALALLAVLGLVGLGPGLLFALPGILVLAVLAAGRFPGEQVLVALASRRRPRRRRMAALAAVRGAGHLLAAPRAPLAACAAGRAPPVG